MSENLKTAKIFAKKIGFDKVTYLGEWNSYECYNISRSSGGDYGYPIVAMFDGKGRMKTAGDEVFKILSYFHPDDEDEDEEDE